MPSKRTTIASPSIALVQLMTRPCESLEEVATALTWLARTAIVHQLAGNPDR